MFANQWYSTGQDKSTAAAGYGMVVNALVLIVRGSGVRCIGESPRSAGWAGAEPETATEVGITFQD